jgi:DNA-binding HxlR family transcriptional regulator
VSDKDSEFQTLLSFFKVLGNASRLTIVGALAQGETSVSDLATLVGLKEPTVSHHLTKLSEVGLVSKRVDGNTHLYRLERRRLEELSKKLYTTEGMQAISSQVDASTYERKVLQAFTEGSKLLQIPASRKKRLVILHWLLRDFEHGRKYTEKEVNERLLQHHWDSATLRREFIANKLMAREHGIYWRL